MVLFFLERVAQDPFWGGASENSGLDSLVGRYRKEGVVVLLMIVEGTLTQLRIVQGEL